MTYVLYACLAGILVGMGVVIVRLQKGPSNLDRAVALDVITSAVVGTVVITMALTGRVDLLPLLVVFSSVAFISSTTIARFSQAEAISERRILTPAEAAAEGEPRFSDTDAPVHPDADEIIAKKTLPGDER
ncbi:MAG: monovalent cation/H+ antiporter complex subunit F [Brooklawnia sp.]|uniref:monovalent cation/H+ antiporter complex subunit F n=1 Tax=Brooklawnia sp. TaxID=2699740 RepID=UPI003C70F712